jgi:hypothetical protein
MNIGGTQTVFEREIARLVEESTDLHNLLNKDEVISEGIVEPLLVRMGDLGWSLEHKGKVYGTEKYRCRLIHYRSGRELTSYAPSEAMAVCLTVLRVITRGNRYRRTMDIASALYNKSIQQRERVLV